MRLGKRHYLRMIASTALLLGMASNGLAQDFQLYGPLKTYTKPLSDQNFFSPSITKKLPAGHRVAGPPMIMDGSVVIQRLTERSYWVMLGSHSTTVFVGDIKCIAGRRTDCGAPRQIDGRDQADH